MSPPLLPLFLKLDGRLALVVGAGRVAAPRIGALCRAGARVRVVAPAACVEAREEIALGGAWLEERPFEPRDLEGAWLAVAAASPEVNREVVRAAEPLRLFVNAVDDPGAATAYAPAVLRRGGVLLALSTEGRAPALAGLLREALSALLPEELERWGELAERLRARQRSEGLPLADRRPALLEALLALHAAPPARPGPAGGGA